VQLGQRGNGFLLLWTNRDKPELTFGVFRVYDETL